MPYKQPRATPTKTLWSHGDVEITLTLVAAGRYRLRWRGEDGGGTIATFRRTNSVAAVAHARELIGRFLRGR